MLPINPNGRGRISAACAFACVPADVHVHSVRTCASERQRARTHTRIHGEHSPARWYKSRVIAILPCQTAAACRIRPRRARGTWRTEGTLSYSAVRVQCTTVRDYGIPRDGRTGRPLELVSGNHPDNYVRGKNAGASESGESSDSRSFSLARALDSPLIDANC